MEAVLQFLHGQLKETLLPFLAQREAAQRFGLSFAAIERIALENGILPARYQRNRQMISITQQRRLSGSSVAVVGCGGLGGYVIEELARLGVGKIIAIDPDIFEEHNLNRQLLATAANLGRSKVEAALHRVAEINPAVQLIPYQAAYTPENGTEMLGGAYVVVDALDSIPTRLSLAQTCAELGIPMVHGAIGGWYGQIATQFPGDDTIQRLYSRWVAGKGVEQQLGNPSFTPAVVASLEAAEVCKILLGEGECLRHRKLVINLLDMEFEEVYFGPHLEAVGE